MLINAYLANKNNATRELTDAVIMVSSSASVGTHVVFLVTLDEGKKTQDDSFYVFAERAKKRTLKCIEMIADHNP